MKQWYLQNKYEWWLALGGQSAVCPLSGTPLRNFSGEYHHILGRPSTDNVIFRLASDKHLCILLSNEAHRQYHDHNPSNDAKDMMFQKVYEVWGKQYGSVDIAYDMALNAYQKLNDALRTSLNYRLPRPLSSVKKWRF